MPYSYSVPRPHPYSASYVSDPVASVAAALRGNKRSLPGSVIMSPSTGKLYQATGGGADYGQELGRMAYGAAQEPFPVVRSDIEQAASWLNAAPGSEKMDVYAMADGSLRAGYEYAERHNRMYGQGADLNQNRPIYQGAEVDVFDVAEHLRVLKLFPKVQGYAPRRFHVAKGFHHEMAEFLDYRIVIADPNVGGGYRQGPFAEVDRMRSDFYEAEVTCRKDRETIGYPVETVWRSNKFSPVEIDSRNAAYSLAYKRNKSCIAELLQIGNRLDGTGAPTTNGTLSSMTERVSTHGKSANNVLAELLEIKASQAVTHKVEYDTIQMGPLAFLFFTQNDFSRGGGEFGRTPVAMPSGGVVELPTMPGVKVIIDMRNPRDRIFFYERDTCCWIGEGPKRVDVLEAKSSQATYADFTDWYDATAIHPQIKDETDRFFGATLWLHADDRNAANAGG